MQIETIVFIQKPDVEYHVKMTQQELGILYALTGYSSSDSLNEASLKVLGIKSTYEDSYVLGDMFMVIEKAFNEPKGR